MAKEFDLASHLFYSPPTPSYNLGPSGRCTKLPASPAYILPQSDKSTQTTATPPPKVSRRRKTKIKNRKDFLDSYYNSDEKKKKQRRLLKKLNCYKNLEMYKKKHRTQYIQGNYVRLTVKLRGDADKYFKSSILKSPKSHFYRLGSYFYGWINAFKRE